jgi:RNA polymerase sigma factor (sigma-70 family)
MGDDDAYRELRPLLFSIAYRMVGSVSEAEDLVQEAFLRFHRAVAGGEQVASPRAWLSAVTTRLAIDHLRSARARRERYVGAWLPEPLVTEPDASAHAETADTLSLAFLHLLERLSPVQRAVFLLRLLGVLALDIADGRVQTVRSIVNPDKLRHLGPVGDLSALLGG